MNRLRNKEEGFTLVELMIVVLIIAILAGIAIPTFLNTRKRSQDQAAKSNLRNALSAAQALYAETQTYTGVTATTLGAEEPSLDFVASTENSDGAKEIVVEIVGTDTLLLAAKSTSDKCWIIRHKVATGADAGSMINEKTGDCDTGLTGVGTWKDL